MVSIFIKLQHTLGRLVSFKMLSSLSVMEEMLIFSGFVFSSYNDKHVDFFIIRESNIFLKDSHFPPNWCTVQNSVGYLKPSNITSVHEQLPIHGFHYYSSSFLQSLCLPFNLSTNTVNKCMSGKANIFLFPGRKGNQYKGQRVEFPPNSAKEFTARPLQNLSQCGSLLL